MSANPGFADVLMTHVVILTCTKLEGEQTLGRGPLDLSDLTSEVSEDRVKEAQNYYNIQVSRLGLPLDSASPLIEKFILGRCSVRALYAPANTIPVPTPTSVATNQPTGGSSITHSIKSGQADESKKKDWNNTPRPKYAS